MKLLRKISNVIICISLICACTEFEDAPDFTSEETASLKSSTIINVAPSGDLSGVDDANNIEEALNNIGAGGTVFLSDGDGTTVDHYYTSRNIVTFEFNGTLQGEGMDNTIITPGRKSDSEGFAPALSQYWNIVWPGKALPSVFQFDFATGTVAVKDFSIIVTDAKPTIPWMLWGKEVTKFFTLIESMGGNHNTVLENLRFEGMQEDSPQFPTYPTNILRGIHVMLGTRPGPGGIQPGIGDLKIKNIIAETNDMPVGFMRFSNSQIIVDNITANNVSYGIDAEIIDGSSIKISNSDITLNSNMGDGMYLVAIPSGLEVKDNIISGGHKRGIQLGRVNNAIVVNNTIKDQHLDFKWGAAINLSNSSKNKISKNKIISVINGVGDVGGIAVRNYSSGNIIEQNDYKNSNIPGWTDATPNGPGAIFLHQNSSDNLIFEMKFPPSVGVTLCEMLWDKTDDPTLTEYDGKNSIQNYQPCENLAKRDGRKEELELELETLHLY